MPPKGKRVQERESEQLLVSDVDTLKALAEPTRLRILLELTSHARTVKEVAASLDLPPTGLYYHFKILEKNGLIRVTGRRMVSGIEERSYEATAPGWGPSPEMTSSLVSSGVVGAMLNLVRAELEIALTQDDGPIGEPGGNVPVIILTRLALAPDEVEQLQDRLAGIMEDFGEEGDAPPGKRIYHALFGAYRSPTELKSNGGRNER